MSTNDGGPAFTPGPWDAIERGAYTDYDGNSRVIIGDDMRICVVHHHGKARDEANARLISAAPDMYEALKELAECSQYWSDYDVPIGIHDRIVAALAKAAGQ